MSMKYIVFDIVNLTTGVPIIFPSFINHIDVANNFGGVDNVLSAGSVSFSTDVDGVTVECYGESASLHIKSRPEDYRIITSALRI